jgi:hypothetical protein
MNARFSRSAKGSKGSSAGDPKGSMEFSQVRPKGSKGSSVLRGPHARARTRGGTPLPPCSLCPQRTGQPPKTPDDLGERGPSKGAWKLAPFDAPFGCRVLPLATCAERHLDLSRYYSQLRKGTRR